MVDVLLQSSRTEEPPGGNSQCRHATSILLAFIHPSRTTIIQWTPHPSGGEGPWKTGAIIVMLDKRVANGNRTASSYLRWCGVETFEPQCFLIMIKRA